MPSILKLDTIQENTSGGGVNFSHPVELPNGTAAAPGLAFSSDTNSGLYRISEDKIGIATNGTRVGEIGAGYGGFTGNIIQVVTTIKTNTFNSTVNNTWTNITDLAATITPKYSTSKIFVSVMINTGGGGNNYARGLRVTRGGTPIGVADAGTGTAGTSSVFLSYNGGSNSIPITLLDSPSTTSSTTYQVQFHNPPSSTTGFWLNQAYQQDSNAYLGTSTITLMEVQQ